jgi:hypothetical protein
MHGYVIRIVLYPQLGYSITDNNELFINFYNLAFRLREVNSTVLMYAKENDTI